MNGKELYGMLWIDRDLLNLSDSAHSPSIRYAGSTLHLAIIVTTGKNTVLENMNPVTQRETVCACSRLFLRSMKDELVLSRVNFGSKRMCSCPGKSATHK